MKYLSLFSGIGGFELGIQQAHVAITHRDTNRKGKGHPETDAQKRNRLVAAKGKASPAQRRWNGELPNGRDDSGAPHCVGYSEIDKYASAIYQKHFGNHKNYGDITKINEKELPDFNLLVGGFPCQSFSIAGKRKGFEDTRGTLFFDIARILREKKPRLILLENVKGLLSHDNGNTFKTIISTLDELGYDLQWQVLNSKDFGVPQNRERVFIVGHTRGTPRPKVFPFGEGDEISDEKSKRETQTTHPVRAGYKAGQGGNDYIRSDKPSAQQKRNQPNGTNRIRRATYSHDSRIRRLTPLECERLQGFPDHWTHQGMRDTGTFLYGFPIYDYGSISDTQRYKCIGNAVTVNVIQAIMEKLL